MAAQAFTNFAGQGGANQPTSFVAADGFVGPPASAFNPGSPTFGVATFPSGVTIPAGATIHGGSVTATLSLPVTAATNTDFTVSLPTGSIIQSMTVYTTTAYGAVTDAVISIGSAAAGAQYVAATSIKAQGVVTLVPVTTAAPALLSLPAGTPNIFVRIAQSGGNSATGAGKLVISYTVP